MKPSLLGAILTANIVALWAGAWEPASAAIQVSNPIQLAAALERAKGGETIQLAPGSYGVLAVLSRKYASPVTITGPAAGPRPQISALRVSGSSAVRLENLDIGSDLPAKDGAYARIQASQGITLARSHVHGSRDGNPQNDGPGVHVTGSSDIEITASEIDDVQVGVMILKSEGVTVTQSHIHTIRADGIIAAGTDRLSFRGNYITDFYPLPADHSDAIQLHNTGMTKGIADVVIADNVILQGKGARVQGIWVAAGEVHGFRNLTIDNNLIYINDYYNGIGLYNVTGARVTNNTVVSRSDDKATAWIRLKNSTGITLENNVSDFLFVQEGVSNVTENGNFFFRQNTTSKCLFAKLDAGPAARMDDLVVTGIGFQPNANIHPLLRDKDRTGVAALLRADARRRCGGRMIGGAR